MKPPPPEISDGEETHRNPADLVRLSGFGAEEWIENMGFVHDFPGLFMPLSRPLIGPKIESKPGAQKKDRKERERKHFSSCVA